MINGKKKRKFKRKLHKNKIELYKDRPTVLYYVKINEFWKIGITLHEKYEKIEDSIISRFKLDINNGIKFEILKGKIYEDGSEAYLKEQKILFEFSEQQYNGDKFLIRHGETEMFTRDIFGVNYK